MLVIVRGASVNVPGKSSPTFYVLLKGKKGEFVINVKPERYDAFLEFLKEEEGINEPEGSNNSL